MCPKVLLPAPSSAKGKISKGGEPGDAVTPSMLDVDVTLSATAARAVGDMVTNATAEHETSKLIRIDKPIRIHPPPAPDAEPLLGKLLHTNNNNSATISQLLDGFN